jgi:hypothetical protein
MKIILVILYRILVKNHLIGDIDKSFGDFKIKFGYS